MAADTTHQPKTFAFGFANRGKMTNVFLRIQLESAILAAVSECTTIRARGVTLFAVDGFDSGALLSFEIAGLGREAV